MNSNRGRLILFVPELVFLLISMVSCVKSIESTNKELTLDWQFKRVDDSTWRPAQVPGSVQLDLLKNGLISDPFVGENEKSIQWVEEEQWLYKANFNLTPAQLNVPHLEINFSGLDTYAEVYLNDKHILSTDNMFRSFAVDILPWASKDSNELRIQFKSPVEQNRSKLVAMPYRLPAGSETGEWQVSPFTRKAAYQFGWDFAPRIQTMGIWQPIFLSSWQKARILDIQFQAVAISELIAKYDVVLNLEVDDAGEYRILINHEQSTHKLNLGSNSVSTELLIEQPQLWWPNGLGEAHLYDIPIMVLKDNDTIASTSQKLGVRTVELMREDDTIGESFYFKVNGRQVIMKGANWSPLSGFPSSIPDSVYTNRIRAAKEANMNMLRVWGGGIYEKELFYDLCDANGILVWQDFMFANSMYPGDSTFISNVKEEVREQIIRLRNHPSLALWNGNNEIDVAWHNWGWQKQYGYSVSDSTQLWNDYLKLFHEIIPGLLARYDSSRPYTPTSPLSNWGTPENFNSGSMHYWGVWHGNDDFDDFKSNTGRFMAEYGFQSYPNSETFKSYYQLSVFYPDSNEILHQKSYVGNKLILSESEKYFGAAGSLEQFLEYSQLTQAMALKIAIETHRLARDKCGGTLFWQLNDCWPGPSWSIIDYYGNKKIAYDVVKDRFKPIILIPVIEANAFSVSVVNDSWQDVEGSLKLELYKGDGNRLWVKEIPVAIEPNIVKNIYRSDVRKILDGMKGEDVYLKLTLIGSEAIHDIEAVYFTLPKNYIGEFDLVGRD